ncbi:hypothetical protein D3C79_640480 [compost metagenome]
MTATADLNLTEQHRAGRGPKAHAVSDAYLFDTAFLAGKPAAFGQVLGQDAFLQGVARRGVEQLLHAFFQHQGGEFRQTLRRFLVPAGHLVLGRQQEPVKAVWWQSQQKRQLANWRKGAGAEHLHRHHVGVLRQFQFGRLSGTRDVGDAQNDLAAAIWPGVFTNVSQDPAVARREHFQAASTKGLLLLAHRQQAAIPVQQ